MKTILTTFGLLLSTLLQAQNLIPNPGFDDVNICIEYTAKCAPQAWTPTAPFFSKIMYDGDNPVSNHKVTLPMEIYTDPNNRPYYKTQLLNPMRKGTRYKVEAYVLDNRYTSCFLDIRLDTAETFQDLPLRLPVPPTLSFNRDTGKYVAVSKTYIKFEQEIKAGDNYRYIVLGNFHEGNTVKGSNNIYTYIDSIAITPLDNQPYNAHTADSIKQLLYSDHWRHSYSRPAMPMQGGQLKAKIVLPTRVIQHSGRCDTVVLASEFFSGNRKDINSVYADQLGNTFLLKPENVKEKIIISGYSYLKPNPRYNEIIATDRANEVANYLVYKKGFSFDDFIIKGYSKPREGMDTVEMVEIISCQPAPEPPATPVTRTDTLLIPDVLFKFDSSTLNQRLYASLDSILMLIPDKPGIQLAITGHTDNKGTNIYNEELSLKRANAVAAYLRRKKPAVSILTINGMGETMPVADNSTPQGRQKNRRVEIIIFYPQEQD
ncbi:OmpA family protein [Chitinophaga sp. Cy-1792]|uniref:OmpA family protein n=1 Tax=Chitinophaga sp. Cy-1792 TaxID=2608339 RepID=UPI001420A640|nr:OmpA family protein [Chitinophaga sp. Cy-1792]NIG53956.1 OmpA family protein [Chitinophaga sp. Cy-1792]